MQINKIKYDIKLCAWKLIWKFPRLAMKLKVKPTLFYPKKYMPKVKTQ